MSEEDDFVKDMSLEDEPQEKKLDMDLDKGPDIKKPSKDVFDMSLDDDEKPVKFSELEARVKEQFPYENYVYITPNIVIARNMASGDCKLNRTCFKSLEDKDLKMIDKFLKSKKE